MRERGGSHSSHWGSFHARPAPGGIAIEPRPGDPRPSPLLGNLPASLRHPSRVTRPAIRRSWLTNGPGPTPARGSEPFVEVEWDVAIRALGGELARVYETYGAEAVYGGSYGWASAGRFHHAQSQVHRFLNCLGGYTRSVNSYSAAAAEVILPRVLAAKDDVSRNGVLWEEVLEHCDLVVAFGGMPLKNADVDPGGVSSHRVADHLDAARDRGIGFVSFSPLRDDLPPGLGATWHGLRPGTDTAVMLAIAHVLLVEGLVDRALVGRLAAGLPELERYVLGTSDGLPKTPAWGESISGVSGGTIADLARRMASSRTLITVSQSLQRAEFGEQPVWMGVALATLLGQLGLPGRGFTYGLGSMANIGQPRVGVRLPTLPQGANRVAGFIPVARVADMLLHPGAPFEYDGARLRYPETRLVYWAGGNPFHHHQDLGRLTLAFGRPDTVVVHESVWTATARHADVVLPATVSLERDDIAASANDPLLVAMHAAAAPHGEAMDDYEIFSLLARELGVEATFTEGRSASAWLEHLYEATRDAAAARDWAMPPFAEFWERGEAALPLADRAGDPVRAFRSDPEGHPLPTPTGRVELSSETIAGFGYADCPGHPAWLEPKEWQGSSLAREWPLLLVANQPARRLHSQLDFGAHSLDGKVDGRERVRIHPDDARARAIRTGDVVRVFNARGSCLAAAEVSDDLVRGVVQLPTGAWYAPLLLDGRVTCIHGNPNVLTFDRGTSSLAQGSCGQHALVEVERFDGTPPRPAPHDPPPIER